MRFFIAVVLGASLVRAAAAEKAGSAAEGAKLYRSRCGKCHALPVPGNYSQAAWDGWMEKMKRKARLKPEDVENLRLYVEQLKQPKGPATSYGGPSGK